MARQNSLPITLAILLATAFAGCGGGAAPPDPNANKMVYVDTETRQAYVGNRIDTPAINPQTGKSTLMPGLYCPNCKTWHAVPPLDQINRIPNARRCVKTRVPLLADGPWPTAEIELGTVSGP